MRRTTPNRPHRASLASIALALCACGGGGGAADAPHLRLAVGYEPLLPALPLETARDGRRTVRLVEDGDGVAVEVRYGTSAWQSTPVPGLWLADLAVPRSLVEGAAAARQTLLVDGRGATRENEISARNDWSVVPDGAFGTVGHILAVYPGAGEPPPREVVHRVPLPLGAPDGDAWRVRTSRWTGEGLLVLPGAPQTLELPPADGPRRATLAVFALVPYEARAGAAPTFAVEVDGRAALTVELDAQEAATLGVLRHAAVDLPAGARELRVRYDGPLGLCGVLEPVAGPLPRGTGAHARDGRPNLVLFVADTLRADALERRRVLADSPDVALPTLARLAERGLDFERAWSSSTWTLPSHASLFTSLPATQHGADDGFVRLVREARTLAEVLKEAGYRTVAVTDGIYVSSEYGLDQGFDLFDQFHGPAPDPLERARAALTAHDGRPTFLFVHTYSAHAPFTPSDASRAVVGVGAAPDWGELARSIAALRAEGGGAAALAACEEVRLVRDLYWAQALDFDGQLDEWLERYDALGWGDSSVLVLTSDHGEAFGDHGQLYHGGRPYESLARVPLLVLGGERHGLGPGRRTDPVAGVDLAPTLAALAGAAVPTTWTGRDLRGPGAATVVSAVRSTLHEPPLVVALTDGRHKLLAEPEGGGRTWYDLARDPDEGAPLAGPPGELARRYERELETLLRPVHEGAPLEAPSAELLEQLRVMGYLDDE